MKSDEAGLAEGGGVEPRGEPGGESGSEREASWMSPRAATAFATTCSTNQLSLKPGWERRTIGLPSPMRSRNVSINPYSTHISGFRSNTFATHNAAVFRT